MPTKVVFQSMLTPSSLASLNSKIDAARMAGVPIMNEKSNADSLLIPLKRPADKVEPERESPGKIEAAS